MKKQDTSGNYKMFILRFSGSERVSDDNLIKFGFKNFT